MKEQNYPGITKNEWSMAHGKYMVQHSANLQAKELSGFLVL